MSDDRPVIIVVTSEQADKIKEVLQDLPSDPHPKTQFVKTYATGDQVRQSIISNPETSTRTLLTVMAIYVATPIAIILLFVVLGLLGAAWSVIGPWFGY